MIKHVGKAVLENIVCGVDATDVAVRILEKSLLLLIMKLRVLMKEFHQVSVLRSMRLVLQIRRWGLKV